MNAPYLEQNNAMVMVIKLVGILILTLAWSGVQLHLVHQVKLAVGGIVSHQDLVYPHHIMKKNVTMMMYIGMTLAGIGKNVKRVVQVMKSAIMENVMNHVIPMTIRDVIVEMCTGMIVVMTEKADMTSVKMMRNV
ncbi:MAG: hypothetical protein ABIG95_05080 [Candidatus Woesearchaeota archaeon]